MAYETEDSTADAETFSTEDGMVVLCDPTAVAAADVEGMEPGDLGALYRARVAAVVTFDEHDVTVAWMDELPARVDEAAQVELQLLGGTFAVGPLHLLIESAGVSRMVVPGRYRVTVWRDAPGVLAVHLDDIERFSLVPPSDAVDMDRTITDTPLTGWQSLGGRPEFLDVVGEAFGSAARRFGAEVEGSWVVRDRLAMPTPADLDLEFVLGASDFVVLVGGADYPGPGAAPEGVTVLTMRHRVGDGEIWARIGVHPATLEIERVDLYLVAGLSDDERERLLAAIAEAAAAAAVPVVSAQRGLEDVQQEWFPDKLTLRLPHPDGKKPKLTVQLLTEQGAIVEELEAFPLRRVDGFVVYEVWLLGRRAGLRRARAFLR